MKKLAIIGASYLQMPLIMKAKKMGIETHVFAWKCGDPGEEAADYFYPISITEKEDILEKCKQINIDGIISIASDLAMVAVNYVASYMGLVGNSLKATEASTNKHTMRKAFEKNGDPSPKSFLVESSDECKNLDYPVIVKPLDRSGSRGITKLYSSKGLNDAIDRAKDLGFIKKALVEEFAEGQEYSVECISYNGVHHYLTSTKKFTTGAPNFIETGHLEPGHIDGVQKVIFHALDSLGVKYGASHSEVKVDDKGNIKIIEIGGRMGGDFIGSDLVRLSTGFDFVEAVIEVALGIEPNVILDEKGVAAVRYIFSQDDIDELSIIDSKYVFKKEVNPITDEKVVDSASRFGYYILRAKKLSEIEDYLPKFNS